MNEDLKNIYVQGHTPFKCYRDFILAVVLIILAIVAPCLAYVGSFMPANENAQVWFQRSGSITVMLSLIAEYVISRLHGIIRPAGLTSDETEKIRKAIESPLMFLRYFGGAVAVVGTVVWGYGDILV